MNISLRVHVIPQINALCKVIPRQIKAEKAVSIIREAVEELIAKCREIVEAEGERINEEEYVNDADPSILRFLLASREEVLKLKAPIKQIFVSVWYKLL